MPQPLLCSLALSCHGQFSLLGQVKILHTLVTGRNGRIALLWPFYPGKATQIPRKSNNNRVIIKKKASQTDRQTGRQAGRQADKEETKNTSIKAKAHMRVAE